MKIIYGFRKDSDVEYDSFVIASSLYFFDVKSDFVVDVNPWGLSDIVRI